MKAGYGRVILTGEEQGEVVLKNPSVWGAALNGLVLERQIDKFIEKLQSETAESNLVDDYMAHCGWEWPTGDMSHDEYDMAVETVKWFIHHVTNLDGLLTERRK